MLRTLTASVVATIDIGGPVTIGSLWIKVQTSAAVHCIGDSISARIERAAAVMIAVGYIYISKLTARTRAHD